MSDRPYQDLTRAEISAKQADNHQSRSFLKSKQDDLDRQAKEHDETLWVEVKKMFGRVERQKKEPDLSHMQTSMRLSSQRIEINNMLIGVAKDDQALQFELHIRDTPDLVREFGPGAD